MIDPVTDSKLVERRLPKIGARTFPFGRTWGELALFAGTSLVLCAVAARNIDSATILACLAALGVNAAVFFVPVNKLGESVIHVAPRYARFVGRVAAGQTDVHYREREGRHYTHRPIPADTPMSVHLGERMWLSSFDDVALIVEGGTFLKPWRSSYTVAVQICGHDQLLLESVDYQEKLIQLWNVALDTLHKKNLKLTAIQQLLVSRPMREGEGAHRTFEAALTHQTDGLADSYRAVQLMHDETDTDRRMYLALKSGGTFGSWFKARHFGSNRAGVEEHFRSILAKLPTVLRQADLTMLGPVTRNQMSALFRLLTDPKAAPHVGYHELERATRPVATQIPPIAQFDDTHYSHIVVNGMFAATYRVSGWPDRIVGPHFLNAAILNHQAELRVAIPIAPDDPNVAKHSNRAGMTNTAGKQDRKAASGTITTEAERQADALPYQRDVEMGAGHAPAIWTGYMTLIADDEASLRRAADDLATMCDQAGVDLQCTHGYQGAAYWYTLPLCRGLG